MALKKSSVLLPSVFQTNRNEKFLNATVDQLISEPNLKRFNSFIGRKFAPNFTVGDGYIKEARVDRQNYQLEPAVVSRNDAKQIEHLTGYIDFVNKLGYNNVNTTSHNDLFSQLYYNYSGFVDFDKLVNYGEYFWLPAGPDSVQVFNSIVDTEKTYTVYRSGDDIRFDSTTADPNITIILARGGTYNFKLSETGNPFWIQTETGTSGISSYSTAVSTREVLGVSNNGATNGTVTFTVPAVDAQNEEINAVQAANPDFATDLTYKQIHNQPYSTFIDTHGGIDKQTIIDGKSLVFINTTTDASAWDQGSLFDAYGFDDDDNPFDETTSLGFDVRYDVYNISVNTIGGVETIVLTRSTDWPVGQKVKIKQGDSYGNREFFKGGDGLPKLIAPYTAGASTLYYQDGSVANKFGKIKLVEIDEISPIDIENDIVGKTVYTSDNGVTFTNGLKIEFNSDVTPSTYASREYFVEGVGQPQGITLTPVDELLTPETYSVSSSDGFDTVAYDAGGWDGTLNAPLTQDYIVINRSSPDRNAWSRGNRWFHRAVIEATAGYNDYTAVIDDSARAKRPIIEFYGGLELYNMGTTSKAPVTVVDNTQTDAFSNVNGSTGYFSDGIDLQQDNTVIFSADSDSDVSNKVYRVDIVDQDANISTDPIINLVQIDTVADGDCILSTLGATNQGKQYWLDGTTWRTAQQKTAINQDPLFDIFDPDHVSFSDQTKYPSSNFVGNKLFSYKRNGSSAPDAILNFGLTYKNFSTLGDIVFDNNFDTDKFQYTKSTGNVNVILRSGHVHQFDAQGARSLYNGWTKVLEQSVQYQVVSYDVTATELYSFEIGASVDTTKTIQPLRVFVNGKFIVPSKYTHLVQSEREYVVFTNKLAVDDVVTIKFFSNTKSQNSFYEVPSNLENNSSNATFPTLTLGQMRNHVTTFSTFIKDLSGAAPGNSNIRDKNFRGYPGNILQHSAGLITPMYALTSNEANIIKSINYVKNEYTKFKNNFIDNINKLDLDLTNPSKCVDDIITHMVGKKTSAFPFYYSDMLSWGSQKSQVVYTIDDSTEVEFEFTTQFDLTSISNRGVLVYKNTTLLVEGKDYTFDTVEAKVLLTTNNLGTSNIGLVVNDIITIVEYSNNEGSFCPPTPSKLGLYYKFEPSKYTDNTYTTAKTVVQGHDGSTWVGYNDIRDDIILEFEKRIYNNIKTQYKSNLFDFSEVKPGYFRSSLVNLNESNNIIRSYFGEWALKNKVRTQENTITDNSNLFTWNYTTSVNTLNRERIPGYWRGMYRWFYDTDTPHTTPWEMLGLSVKPIWWNDRYGEAPYTSGNTVLWEDLRDGKLYSDATGTKFITVTNRSRPDLLSILPVDPQGNLRAPGEFLTEGTVVTNNNDPWAFSDGSPAETAWVRSSEYPFVMQILAANLRPAKYGALMFDTNLLEYNADYDQILQTGKSYRSSIVDFHMHGMIHTGQTDIHRVEGYNQFISEYLRFTGYSINDAITKINNLELNLCYGVAGFTDKQYLKVIAESVTPSSESENIFIPDENINIYLKKSLPLERILYSGVQIIIRQNGYELQGYDTENPFFKIIPSEKTTDPLEHTVGQNTFFEFQQYENIIANIPYGTIITTKQQVFDFLVSYQRYLLSKGFVFDGITSRGDKNDFITGAKEFAFWTDQNWEQNSVIVLSPFSEGLKLNRSLSTVDDITINGNPKDANGSIINPKFYDVSRIDNLIEIILDKENTQLYSVQLDPIQYEHAIVLDNKTIFNDVIFQPELGNRHDRLKLIGSKSGDWNGTLHAPGFFLNEDKFNIWQSYVDYKKGDLVSFQNKIYSAKYEITGSNIFEFDDWNIVKNMQTGLIKNLTNKANQFKEFFEIDGLNLEDGVDKLGKGTIGFNQKDYLAGLGLDDVSQVKFYQGMIKQKGTGTAINKLIDAELTNLDQTIDYFEEWAFRVGEYGSIDSNQIIEAIIPEENATNNPVVIHYHNNGELSTLTDDDHYHIQQKDLYITPNNYTSDVFPIRNTNTDTKNDLDTAGYARLDDVNYTAFSADELVDLSNNLAVIGKGDKIWTATDTNNTWSIRRVDETLSTITNVQSTGNGYLIYSTDTNHGLVKDDFVIIRAQRPIGKVAKVFEVSSPSSFTIADATTEADIQNVNIPMFKLSNVRFTQASDLSSYTPVNGWNNKEIVWIDKDKQNKWSVLQNTRPWTTTGIKSTASVTASDNLGTSITINAQGTLAIAGAPEQGAGAIIPFRRAESGALVEGNIRTDATIGDSLDRFGEAVTAGIDYIAVGAPETESGTGAVFIYFVDVAGDLNRRPAIRPSGLSSSANFGKSVVMSGNGRYLFVGAPGDNTIYTYTLVTIPGSSVAVDTITSDTTKVYSINFTPISQETLNVVDQNGKVYLPNKDFTLSGSSQITFTANPANLLQIVVRQQDYFALSDTITPFDSMSGDNYGYSIDCDYSGRNIVVGAPNASVAGTDSVVTTNAGEVSIISQVVQQFAGNGSTKIFTTQETLQTKIFVEVDGILQTETDNADVPTDNDGSSEGFYLRSGKTITFKYSPASGAKIVVYTGTYFEKQKIDQNVTGQTPSAGEQFGYSVAIDSRGTMVAIGSPGEDETDIDTGSVFIFQDSGKNHGAVTTNTPHNQTSGDTFYIDNRLITVTSSADNPSNLASDINLASIPGVTASVDTTGAVVITSTNTEELNKLTINPGTGQMFARDDVFEIFKFTQKINHPQGASNENFGRAVAFDKYINSVTLLGGTRNLVASSDKASTRLSVRFDVESNENKENYLDATTTFDAEGTTFTDKRTESGAAYLYELLDANSATIDNPDKLVFGQQLTTTNVATADQFGFSVAFNDNRIYIGSPQDTVVRGSVTLTNSGSVYEFNNDNRLSSWTTIRNEDTRIDVTQINRVALYNKKTKEIGVFLDYIDPVKGKIAGVANAELSYVSKTDPAMYVNNLWSYKYKHRLWWDTSTVHYLNAEQSDLDYRKNYWGTTFPGSTIDVYEWIESNVPPSEYTGEGTVKNENLFTSANVYNSSSDSTQLRYYFWVSGRTDIPAEAEFRTISADSVRSLIEDPKAQGLPYVAFLDRDAVALYNCKDYFADKDTVFSVNYDVVKNEGVLHSEFELFGKGNTDQDIPTRIYNKLVDSLAGADSVGNIVPDPFLSEVEKYGVLTQPRQSIFVNRASALKVLVEYCNKIFKTDPFAKNSTMTKLLSSENIPTVNSGEYNKSVDTLAERDYLNTAILSTGYKVLVLEDETQSDYWTIYSLNADKTWLLVNIQGYNTADYWSYATYYATGYDSTTVPNFQVPTEADLQTLTTAVEGDVAKVVSNDSGDMSMFVLDSNATWNEVITEKGTIQFNDSLYSFATLNSNFQATGFDNDGFDFGSFDKVPTQEIRQIFDALKNDIFIDTYKINMNELFFRLMEYALNETSFTNDWIFKTSFISVAHKLRSLDQYNTFKYDNTTFIENFIEEVKPYKTKIREYISKYDKVDQFDGDTTDFDLHPFYDSELSFFRSPSGDYSGDEVLQTQGLNKPWSENYGYKLDSISIVNAGSGYLTDPTVAISAPQLAGGVQATAVATTNGDIITSITMTNKGNGYTSEPTVTITGSGTGILVSPRIQNSTVRSFDTTIKFDRITYSSSIKDWTASTSYTAGDIVAYQNTTTLSQEVYTVAENFTSGSTFSVENTSGTTVLNVKSDEEFTNTADRISAYYYPSSGMIGDDLELLQKGTGYLGNKVTGPGFDQNPGFDSSNFDVIGFDNFEIDEEGLAVLAGVDTIFRGTEFANDAIGSEYLQSGYVVPGYISQVSLGLDPESIIIDGSGFVDTYNSHAPEELIPGRVYDTLDMEVYTHPGHDYEVDGGAPHVQYTFFSNFVDNFSKGYLAPGYTEGDYVALTETTISQRDFQYGDPTKSSEDYEYLIVYQNDQRIYNFTTNYTDKTVTLSGPILATDIIHVYAYSQVGEKIVGEYTEIGDGSSISFVLGNTPALTKQTLVYVDGVETSVTIGSQDDRTTILFNSPPDNGANIHIFVFNQATDRDAPSKIALQTQNLTAGTFTYNLTNTVNYAQPFTANTVVEIDNIRLRPANSKYYTGNGVITQYNIAISAGEVTIGNVNDVGVTVISKTTGQALNGVRNVDFTVTAGNNFITMTTPPADGDTVIVYNNADAEYIISASGQEITINSSVSFTSSSVMRVNTFSNHDLYRMQTKVFVGNGSGTGTYTLDRAVANVNNFWITLNGSRLHPGEYITNGSNINLSDTIQTTLTGSSLLVVTHISENTIQPSTGFRIFYDMNGNTEYLRLSKDSTTEVTATVLPTDTKIYVDDVSKLPFATPEDEFPGVVFIGGERITYHEVSLDENYITNIRRATAGTAMVQRITPGFLVVDGGKDQTLPSTNTHTNTWYDTGTSTAADGLGLQNSSTLNANFLKDSEAQIPNFRLELNAFEYIVADYVEDGYIEIR